MQHPLGFIDFMENVDGVGMFLLVALLLMSVATWYLIVTKTIANFRMRRHSGAFLAAFWEAPISTWSRSASPTGSCAIRSRTSRTTAFASSPSTRRRTAGN